MVTRVFAADLATYIGREVTVKGWAKFVRNTKSTTFIVLQDVSGTVQLVGPADLPVHVKREDALEIIGRVRKDRRAPHGFEVDIVDIRVIGDSAESLPFLSGSDLTEIGLDTMLDYRPLALRGDRGGTIFRVQAALVEGFRAAMAAPRLGLDLLFRGIEISTGGQRLHRREDLENALRQRGVDPNAFESHLRMFDLGMPPHGGLALRAE
jgi:aspartyl/asparaginyl-tRNA synthetase